jgi:TRAP-type mannitol/chloroaromatic compound transport system permease small subunit
MQLIAIVVRAISALNGLLGRVFSLCSLAIVLVCFAVVVMRYAFSMGSVPMQDL